MNKLLRFSVPVAFFVLAFGASAPLAFAQVVDIVSVDAINDISIANGTLLENAGLPTTADVTLSLGPPGHWMSLGMEARQCTTAILLTSTHLSAL